METKTIAFCNQKGGVAKTTTAANVAAVLADKGKKVLVIDLDEQANLSDAFNIEVETGHSVYEWLKEEVEAEDVVTTKDGIDFIPANIDLAAIESELIGSIGREFRLKNQLSPLLGKYDYCLIDCAPSLGLLVTMALSAADYVVIPTNAERYSTKGITKLFDTIDIITKIINPNLKVAGILITNLDTRTNNSQKWLDVAKLLADRSTFKVFETPIRKTVAVEEGITHGIPVVRNKPSATAAQDYVEFTEELLETIN